MNFTDEQIINCTLLSLKHLRIMYTYFTEEAGTPELFKEADELLQEVTQLQRKTYDLMVSEGWMTPQAQTSENITTAYNQLKTTLQEMN